MIKLPLESPIVQEPAQKEVDQGVERAKNSLLPLRVGDRGVIWGTCYNSHQQENWPGTLQKRPAGQSKKPQLQDAGHPARDRSQGVLRSI